MLDKYRVLHELEEIQTGISVMIKEIQNKGIIDQEVLCYYFEHFQVLTFEVINNRHVNE